MIENNQNRRRNNPQDMTLCELVIKAREEICEGYCKYKDARKSGRISQGTLDAICKYDCPMRKL